MAARKPAERRAGAKGIRPIQARAARRSVFQAIERIRPAAKRNPQQQRVSLWYPITVEALPEAYLSVQRKAASGVEGVTWDTYADG